MTATSKATSKAKSRHSKQREAIMDMLAKTKAHPTAEMVHESIRSRMPNISLGTVYRNLAHLASAGMIIKIQADGDSARYDSATAIHYHFQCRECGRVDDLEMPVDLAMNDAAAKASGATVDSHALCFFGICRDCAAKRTDNQGE
jgi:Fe2+ or Zn2+ uptake regulation protein